VFFSPDEMTRNNVETDDWTLRSFVYLQLGFVIWQQMNGHSQFLSNNKQQQQNEQITHCDAGLDTCHWLWRGGIRTRTDAFRWLNPTATTLEQGAKRTASLIDGCRDSDNASRRVEALGVQALQDRGGKGTFIGGNHRWGGGSIRIQCWRRGL
jgi:hypothetical protein